MVFFLLSTITFSTLLHIIVLNIDLFYKKRHFRITDVSLFYIDITLMLFSQTAASDRLEAGVIIFFVALPLVIALTNMVLDHIRKTKDNPKLSFIYRWQHSKFRMVLVKAILKR